MQVLPLAHEVDRLIEALCRPPTPFVPRTEPAFAPLADVIDGLRPESGGVVVLAGPVLEIRMLAAAIVLGFGNAVIDAGGYAVPGLGDLLGALAGVHLGSDDRDLLLGAAQELARREIGMMSSEHSLFSELPSATELVVLEADRFEGGLAALAAATRQSALRLVVPQDEAEVEEGIARGPWRRLRLRSDRAGEYASGRRHVVMTDEDSGVEHRLAYVAATGRFE